MLQGAVRAASRLKTEERDIHEESDPGNLCSGVRRGSCSCLCAHRLLVGREQLVGVGKRFKCVEDSVSKRLFELVERSKLFGFG